MVAGRSLRQDLRRSREHGTNARYVLDKCRCEACCEAHYVYERDLRRRKAYGGDYWPWTEAEPVRRHLKSLMTRGGRGARDGLGPKRISKITGVPHGTISKLLYGNYRGRPPSRKVRKDVARKLLALGPADAHLHDAEPTWRMIDELVEFGLPKSRIARALGKRGPGLQISKDLVSDATQDAVSRLHWWVYLVAPSFRLSCRCVPPVDVRESLELLPDEAPGDVVGLHPLTGGWSYASVTAAKQGASKVAGSPDGISITREPNGFHWRPTSLVPDRGRAEVVSVGHNRRWTSVPSVATPASGFELGSKPRPGVA